MPGFPENHSSVEIFPFLCLFSSFFLTLPLFFRSLAISFPPSFALFAILSLYSSYWACDHTPWVFALLGLVVSLQSNFRFSCCLAYVSRNAASLSFVLGQPFPLPLSISRQCRSLASSRFILGLLSSACLSFFSCLRPDISSDNVCSLATVARPRHSLNYLSTLTLP